MVPRFRSTITGFYTTFYDDEIYLRRSIAKIPFGVYTCRVRSENSSMIHSANISISLRGDLTKILPSNNNNNNNQ